MPADLVADFFRVLLFVVLYLNLEE